MTLVLVGCKALAPADEAELKVTNGIDVAKGFAVDPYPAVVMLTSSAAGICTGTFVSDRVVLTAAHCLDRTEGGGMSLGDVLAEGAIHGTLVGKVAALRKTDLAALAFPEGTGKAWVSLAPRPPAPAERIAFVGFGRNDVKNGATSGVKRLGYNTSEKRPDGFLHVVGLAANAEGADALPRGEDAATSFGDSGAPLFLNGAIAGVGSGGGLMPDGRKHSQFVDLSSPESCALLAQVVAAGAPLAGYEAYKSGACTP